MGEEAARMSLAVLRLQFVAASGLSSWLIERFGGTPEDEFSHVDIMLPDGSLLGARNESIGGKPPGVQIRKQGYDVWRRRVVLALPVSAQAAAAAMRFGVAQIDSGYDQSAICGFILDKNWHAKGKWICSAFATAYLQAAGFMRELIVEPQQVSPNGLALAFSAIGARAV